MNIKAIKRRDVTVPSHPKHYEFTVILESGDHVRMIASELLDFRRCQTAILEQTGHLVLRDFMHSWHEEIGKYLGENEATD